MIGYEKNFTEEKIKSPARRSRQGYSPDIICCHQSFEDMETMKRTFASPKSKRSAHYGVGADGRVYNFVDLRYGCVCEPGMTEREAVANMKAVSLNRLVKERGVAPHLYTVHIEFETHGSGALTPQAYRSGLEVMKYVVAYCRKKYGVLFPLNREHIVGHYEMSPVTAPFCPGLDFPINELVRDMREDMEPRRGDEELS